MSDVIDAPRTNISGTSPVPGRQQLKLVLRRELTKSPHKSDLALLQLDPPDALSMIFPIDVSFRPPTAGAIAFAMGYSRGEPDLSKQQVEVTKITAEQGIIVKASSYPGDSGSPLLSNSGIAIGITRARIDNAVAHYTPMSDALELLKGIPVTANMSALDDRIRSNKIRQDDLSAELRPGRTPTSTRNVELVSWASKIGNSSAQYADVRDMFNCPIVPAFWHRTLDEAADLLRPIMTAALKAQTSLILAQSASALGRKSLAEDRFAIASRELRNFGDVDDTGGSVPFARCDPTAFLAIDPESVVASEHTMIAFALTATKGQYEQVKKSIGASGAYSIFSGTSNYEEAKKAASREAMALKFNYNPSLYSRYLSQSLSPTAVEMYSRCLELDNKERPGLRIWFNRKEGDYISLNAAWVGAEEHGIGEYNQEPITDNLTVIQKPKDWPKGKTQQILVKRNPEVDGLISLDVGGQRASYVAVRDPVTVPIFTQQVVATKKLTVATTHSGGKCAGGSGEDCVTPQRKGGFLVTGTGRLVELQSRLASGTSYSVTVDTPERICIKLVATTGACEFPNSAEGRVSAVERYPEVP